MNGDNSGSNFLAGLVVGAAIGAITALLFAPKSGREMRESLAEEGRKLRDRAVDEGRRLVERGQELAPEAARNAAKNVKQALT
jgi:gas vesicle protein